MYRSNNYKIFINLINVILEYIKDNECKLTPSGYGLREAKKKRYFQTILGRCGFRQD